MHTPLWHTHGRRVRSGIGTNTDRESFSMHPYLLLSETSPSHSPFFNIWKPSSGGAQIEP